MGTDDAGSAPTPLLRFDRASGFFDHMTQNDQERGEKRGVLSTGRSQKLGKTKDADAEAAEDDDDEE